MDGGAVEMAELFVNNWARLILATAGAAVLATVGFYLVARVRARFQETPPPASELLTNFRELHSKGELSDEEYRTIKSMLADRLQEELTNKVKEG